VRVPSGLSRIRGSSRLSGCDVIQVLVADEVDDEDEIHSEGSGKDPHADSGHVEDRGEQRANRHAEDADQMTSRKIPDQKRSFRIRDITQPMMAP
jgi:hypothetical protein